jgi:hypothetical protein
MPKKDKRPTKIYPDSRPTKKQTSSDVTESPSTQATSEPKPPKE